MAAAALARESARCEHGRLVWLLYVINQVYIGLLCRWRSNRVCPFPEDGPALIIANHRSPVDPLLLWFNLHRAGPRRRIRAINFMMAREYYVQPALNWMYRALRSIPVDRSRQDIAAAREALRRLKAGELLGIFPEGRINSGNELLEAGGSGAAYLALRAKVPVYPVYIHNAPRGSSMVTSFFTPSRVRVIYGEPIDLTEYAGNKRSQEELEELTRMLMNRLAELQAIAMQGAASEGARSQ